jgi:phosphatidylglycerol:prolipoprotein diacylglycerol transferase
MNAPDINPIAIQFGPLAIHWYAISYLAAFGMAWWLGNRLADRPGSLFSREQVADFIFYGALGILLGGRIGYILFYKPGYYFDHPLEMFFLWRGGMSFHGGMLGTVFALWLYARHLKTNLLTVTDFIGPLVPLGLGFGRIANFINQELWGRITDVPWAMVFRTGGPFPRHPSQLYEAFLEGLVLFTILWLTAKKPRPTGMITGIGIAGYGVFRMFVEFFRQPDAHLGYLAFGWLTMGHLLSLPMVLFGVGLALWSVRRAR